MKHFIHVGMIFGNFLFINAMEYSSKQAEGRQLFKINVESACKQLQEKRFDQLIAHTGLLNDLAAAHSGADVVQAVRYAFYQHTKHDPIMGSALALRESELLETLLVEYPEVYDTLVSKGMIRQPTQ